MRFFEGVFCFQGLPGFGRIILTSFCVFILMQAALSVSRRTIWRSRRRGIAPTRSDCTVTIVHQPLAGVLALHEHNVVANERGRLCRGAWPCAPTRLEGKFSFAYRAGLNGRAVQVLLPAPISADHNRLSRTGGAVKQKVGRKGGEGFPAFLPVRRDLPDSGLQGERRTPFQAFGSDHRARASFGSGTV